MTIPNAGGGQNHLLAALPPAENARLKPYLHEVHLLRGQVLAQPGDDLEFAYFPLDGVLSLSVVMDNDMVVEVATVGNEGFVGVTALLSGNVSSYEVVCQTDCVVCRMALDELRAAFRDSARLRTCSSATWA